MRDVTRGKKGVSPVIATLLLILIAVAAAVILYSYVMGWLGGAMTGASVRSGQLSLDSAKGSEANTNVTAYVRNVGAVDLTIDRAYESGVNRSFTVTGGTSNTVAVGKVVEVEIDGCTTGAGYTAEIKIVCSDGTTLVFPVKFGT